MLTSLKGNHFETYFGLPYRYAILDGSDELLTTGPYEWQLQQHSNSPAKSFQKKVNNGLKRKLAFDSKKWLLFVSITHLKWYAV